MILVADASALIALSACDSLTLFGCTFWPGLGARNCFQRGRNSRQAASDALAQLLARQGSHSRPAALCFPGCLCRCGRDGRHTALLRDGRRLSVDRRQTWPQGRKNQPDQNHWLTRRVAAGQARRAHSSCCAFAATNCSQPSVLGSRSFANGPELGWRISTLPCPQRIP